MCEVHTIWHVGVEAVELFKSTFDGAALNNKSNVMSNVINYLISKVM